MDIQPTFDNVLVKVKDTLQITSSNIVIPGESRDERGMIHGEVIAVGPRATEFEVGQHVMCPLHWSHQVYWAGIEYALMQQDKIRAKLT